MMQYAKIIVDVPTMQTDQPYTYSIPELLTDEIEIGMRVIVPFGNGKRLVQGFVISLDDDEFDGNVKDIQSIVDLKPVVNTELLDLSKWIANETFSFRITALQLVLPSVMRATYKKRIRLIDEIDKTLQAELFQGQDSIEFDPEHMDAEIIKKLSQLTKNEKAEIVYEVGNKAKVKKQLSIQPKLDFEAYEDIKSGLRKNAKQQHLLINYLQSLTEMADKLIPQKQVVEQIGVTSSTITVGAKNGWLQKVETEVYRDPYKDTVIESTDMQKLTPDQEVAVKAVDEAIKSDTDKTFLLQGVTGSGKTEVYLQTIAKALELGKTALMLVPEIALTPQMVKRVKSRFGNLVAVLHSGLSDGERYDEWRRIERKEAQVVVGARSAVFAPLDNIGVIIVDEEHESSYKQDETPRYHARDVVLWRSQRHHCPVILGSATPSLESRARAQKGVYEWLQLPHRINGQPMPEVTLIDMREEMKNTGESNFSEPLRNEITKRLDKKEQTVLMLNRRGFSSFVMCRDCGFVLPCPNCDTSLTLHMDTHTMKCHYCGHEEGIPKVCPNCHSRKIRYYGTGTQKVEEELKTLYPEARILRMDVDTTRKKGAHEKILAKFGAKEADILLGTQMIAKGLDFPDVTLVGVLNADTALSLPDFRSSERTFQLLTQVSGRAGRAEKKGQVIVQTFNPDHYAIQYAKHHDYESFYRKEMSVRHMENYPPYYYTIQLTASYTDEAGAAKKMIEAVQFLKPVLSDQAIILGPTPKSIMRVNNRFYYQVVIKYKSENHLKDRLRELMTKSQAEVRKGLRLTIDSEPVNFI
ncbi:primosomal protein N' [Dellaglioa sp. BT-FLS60]